MKKLFFIFLFCTFSTFCFSNSFIELEELQERPPGSAPFPSFSSGRNLKFNVLQEKKTYSFGSRENGVVINAGFNGLPYTLSQYGVQVQGFYKKNSWLFGLKGRFIETEFNNIFTRPEAALRTVEEGVIADDNVVHSRDSEYNRIRSARDRWNMILIQPSVHYVFNVLPTFLPPLKSRLGFSFGPGFYNDKAHSLKLKGYLATTEAGIFYPISSKKSIYLDFGVDFNFGHAWRETSTKENIALRKIPIYFLVTALSVTWAL